MTQGERDLDLLQKHVAQLSEHFDTVQIFATRHEGDERGTTNANRGSGNWFARYGQISNWLKREDADPSTEVDDESEE